MERDCVGGLTLEDAVRDSSNSDNTCSYSLL